MAHEFEGTGDVRKFALMLEGHKTAAAASPRTTNLDQLIANITLVPAASTSSQNEVVEADQEEDKNGQKIEAPGIGGDSRRQEEQHNLYDKRGQPGESRMDREDVVTVKYLPIIQASGSSSSSSNNGENCKRESTGAAGLGGFDQEVKRVAENSTTTTIEIVEHIRKNLTLFERGTYETYEAPSSQPPTTYANRGHLQSILNQRQQASNKFQSPPTPPPAGGVKPTRVLSDQYTQYRVSDLIAPQEGKKQRKLVEQPSGSGRNFLKGITLSYDRSGFRSSQPADAESSKDSVQPKAQSSLRRSVSSLNELLKRPLELVKFRRDGQQQQANSLGRDNTATRTKFISSSVDQNSPKEGVAREQQYKVPTVATKQTFSASSSLYLVPTPDETVHIATRLVKDILLSHQRAQLAKASASSSSSSTRLHRSKLIRLFKTYSLRSSSDNLQPSKLLNPNRSDTHHRRGSLRAKSSHQQQQHPIVGRRSQASREPSIDHSVSRIRAKVKMPSGKSDKAIIQDSKDGTIKISYEPKEVGMHEITLRYNDEPIEESPIVFHVDAVGSAKKKITAYGPGLTHGLAGEANKFTINTGGLGSAKLNVAVEGPSKTPVTLSDNKDGTISVGYTPQVPGEYKIKISFDGKQVIGSPFSATIGDEGRQRSYLAVGHGSEHSLDLKISQDDLKTLDAVLITPCTLEEPCKLKLLKSGQLAIVFTPREQGEHYVNVKRRGNHIAGSPFRFDVLSRDIGDAKQVKVSGKGLREGKAGAENEIIINTKDAGYGGLSVSLEGPGRSEIISKDLVVSEQGTLKLFYKPYEPGHYNLLIKYADHVVPGSPFTINVTGQGTNPQKESFRKFRKQVAVDDVNTECHFSFKLPGVSAYDLSARIHTPHGDAEDASVKDKGDYVYQVTFVPKEAGLFALSIRHKDIHMPGSPFPYTVGPLLDFGPHKVRCGGPGLIRGSCNKLNEFNVFTREAGAGELSVLVEGPSKPELTYTDRKDGSCHVGYKVSQPGEYRISVLFNDHEVPESPFRAQIVPQTGDVAKIELGPMPPESMIQLNKPCNMTVIMNGAKGNIEGKVKLPSGATEDCFASPIDAENWGVRFIPRELGIHQVHIKFNKGSMHIPQSPLFIRVGHDKADPAAVMVHGHGLKGATVNHATDFTVETCNAGHAMLEVNIEGPSKVSMGCAELDEGYKISYTPLAAGEYLISIKYNGCHIGSSPFKIRAVKQPGSKQVADIGSHEVSSLAISTTDREAKQKVETMPKFKSDATRVYCKGMGLKKAFAGKPNTLTVNCSEAGFNMIYASFLGPTRNTIHECSVKHMGGSIYEVKYTCKDRGDAILMVKYGDEQIPGSPFRLECV